MKIEDVIRWAKSHIDGAISQLAAIGQQLQGEPHEVLAAVERSNGMFSAAGDLKVWQHVLSIVEGGATVDDLVDELATYAVHGASRIPGSSSFTSNRYEQECTRAYAEVYRDLKRRLDSARKQAEARQHASGAPA